MAIAIFFAIGTLVGGVGAPLLFGWIIGTGSSTALFIGYLMAAALMIFAAATEAWIGVPAERLWLIRAHRRTAVEQGAVARLCATPALTEPPYNIDTQCHRRSETAATMSQFASMNWACRRQVAGIKMERIDANHSGVEVGIRL